MRDEFDSELEHKLDEQRQEYMKELEQMVTRDRYSNFTLVLNTFCPYKVSSF